jgi:hypothetical protein
MLLRCHAAGLRFSSRLEMLLSKVTHLVHGNRCSENDEDASNEPCCKTETAGKVRQGLKHQHVAICERWSTSIVYEVPP